MSGGGPEISRVEPDYSSSELLKSVLRNHLPESRPIIESMEVIAATENRFVMASELVLEISDKLFDPAFERRDREALDRFYSACEAVLATGDGYLEDILDSYVAKFLIHYRPEEIPHVGPLLRARVQEWRGE